MSYVEVPGPAGPLKIAYDMVGEGPPIVLIHGFASNRGTNWRATSWYDTLTKAGRQVIALDMRGHGESDKPHIAEAYDEIERANDVVRLMDHLGLAKADVMGYSMGGFVTVRVLADHPDRIRKAVIAGVGENYLGPNKQREPIAAALRAPDKAAIQGAVPKQFRSFAEQGKNDLEALALCMLAPRAAVTKFKSAAVPALIVVGSKDAIAGSPDPLADFIPNSSVVIVPDRDHMLAVGDRVYKQAVLDFLAAP